ncbi:MAG: DNA-directed RNA polymerase subunit beta' [Ignavibacteria bacterium]|nr:DNA-directed RNA polymerase subunit beta' [Ignavibacteria bacterium]
MVYGLADIKPKQLKKSFSCISIVMASPDTILDWSRGEVTKPETVNYRTFRPEKDGLFCEKIFGPTRDWECHCGKYKRIRYKGIVCDRCGVEVTQKQVRRERMGHISLAVPVVHIWFFKSLSCKIGQLLGISTKDLEKIVYYESFVVVQPGLSGLRQLDLLSEEQYLEVLESLPAGNQELDDEDSRKFIALMGGPSVRELLKRIDVEETYHRLREQVKVETSQQKKLEALKRLRVLGAFRMREDGRPNKPEWMVMDAIPVIPPELRPLVPLEGGRFATSDLNDLYRRVIIRNNRLHRLVEIKAPEVILRNEKRMLQESVDSLFDNSRKATAVKTENNRALKSLSDILKGKQGRFRQNLLGKRVDYSGRSVIVVGPEMKLHECGLPKEMALELFQPLVIRRLIERGITKTVKGAKKILIRKGSEVWEILENVIDGHPVLLNRAPTLHRLGIQAFQPVLVEGKAIKIHPMVCTAFNADFDGDQMAVHVPLSFDAQLEARVLMLSSHNILNPQNGQPIVYPTQDQVLGLYYLTKSKKGDKGEGKIFSSPYEVIIAYSYKEIGLHARIKVRFRNELIETTTGRVIFNQIVPKELGFINELLNKSRLIQIVSTVYRRCGNVRTAEFLDQLKATGFSFATQGGLSVSIGDVVVPKEKEDIISKAEKDIYKIEDQYLNGFITDGERYNKVIDVWSRTTAKIAERLFETLQHSKDGFNSLYMMVDSGARGSKEQVRQLAGMRGLMHKPQKSMSGSAGELIENPIIASFREGLTVLEYFISTHGARKGLADTALKTADAGYLTRRLVDVAQDAVVGEEDCGSIFGIVISALKEGEDIKEPLSERILGRVAVHDVKDPITGKLIVKAGELITEEEAAQVSETAIESVEIRTVLTCQLRRGICAKCYGRSLATLKLVEPGEAVGIIAAQSIGEPGTQLTLRTFHTGGTASLIAEQSNIVSKFDGKIKFDGVKVIQLEDDGAKKQIVSGRGGIIQVLDSDHKVLAKYDVPYGALLVIKDGQEIKKSALLYEWDPYNAVIISDHSGIVQYEGLIDGVTYREEPDEQTGHIQKVVIESRDYTITPTLIVTDKKGEKLGNYILPVRAHIIVDTKSTVHAGQILAKIPRNIGKTRDITGGLPRVTELFEARSRADAAVVAEISGIVKFGKQIRGSREVTIVSLDKKDERHYTVPLREHILVQDGDVVRAGERLTDGSVNPHDILRIKGVNAVQEYLVNEIQEVYRMQGVKINDKHIEVIVRQMMQRVKITDPGDTKFLEGDYVNKSDFNEENEQVSRMVIVKHKGDSKLKEGQLVLRKKIREHNTDLKKKEKKIIEYSETRPASSEPVLLGITQAALTTDSFISAASFQETTKVLAEASIEAKVDYLRGLKENVVVGRLIPAGTGLRSFKDIIVVPVDSRPDFYEESMRLKEEKIIVETREPFLK